jgi:hypothetical protein
MTFVAFKGATAYEMQVGSWWVKILRPRFWNRRAWKRGLMVTIGTQQ